MSSTTTLLSPADMANRSSNSPRCRSCVSGSAALMQPQIDDATDIWPTLPQSMSPALSSPSGSRQNQALSMFAFM